MKTVKLPSAEHPITIDKNPNNVVVSVSGKVVADSMRTLILREGKYPPVLYIPRVDVDMAAFERSADTTYCPYKGDCNYFSVPAGGERSKNAAWTYEAPFEAVAVIRDHLAFYPDRVDAIVETPVQATVQS